MHVLKRQVIVREDLETIWHFFSRPENLNKLTPPDMSFEILTDVKGIPMRTGMIIRYRVKPIAGIPMHWVTEITHLEDKRLFVDEQRFGPYRFWHHQHLFEDMGDGKILLTDILHYKVGYGLMGRWINRIYIGKKLKDVFDYRHQVIEELFDAEPSSELVNA